MSEITTFESRIGRVDCSAEDLFYFVSDIRHFERFIPQGSVTNLKIERDSCSFQASMLGTVTLRISETVKFSKVVFSGNALQINDFTLIVNIIDKGTPEAEVTVIMSAELNPFLKLIAAEPVKQLLERLISGMEKFRGWKDTI